MSMKQEMMLQRISTSKSSRADGYVESKMLRFLGKIEVEDYNVLIELKFSAPDDGINHLQELLNILEPSEKITLVLQPNKQKRLEE